jgi:16S rRNA C1402 (ribose-2'-O) methylase RsmI
VWIRLSLCEANEFLLGTPAEVRGRLLTHDAIKGEITLLVGKAIQPPSDNTPLDEAVNALVRNGTARMDAIEQVARKRGLSKREVYRRLLKL